MRIIFVSFIDANETCEMHTKSDNITTMSGTETDDAINELFNTFHRRYQEGSETKMKGSSFTLNVLIYWSTTFINNNINSPEWIKIKGVTINSKNSKDNNYFQYAITAALSHQNIDNHPERISKLKPIINNYNWKDIAFPSHSKDWRKIEQNNKTIALKYIICTIQY